ncbi:MAG: hypothetical protein U0586_00370 [Candidatus Brocadiaceae bacterium]
MTNIPPSCLIYGKTKNGRDLHVQISLLPVVVVITTYEPDPNGQPREVVIANRKETASVIRRPHAEEGNIKHVGAPMPSMIVNVKVAANDKVANNARS